MTRNELRGAIAGHNQVFHSVEPDRTMYPSYRLPALVFASVIAVLAPYCAAQAQTPRAQGKALVLSEKPDRTLVTLEYLPAANGNQKAGGLGAYKISEDGPGFYMQFITDLNNEGPRVAGDPARFPERNRQSFNEVTAITIGATSRISSQLTFFGGLGLVNSSPVTEKDDSLRRLSSSGRYFVENTSQRENRIGVQVGALFNLNNVIIGGSYNSELGSPQFSLGYAF